MNLRILKNGALYGLLAAAIAAAIGWVWVGRGQGYHGYDALIVAMFSLLAFFTGFTAASLGMAIRDRNGNRALFFVIFISSIIVAFLARLMFYPLSQPQPTDSTLFEQLQTGNGK